MELSSPQQDELALGLEIPFSMESVTSVSRELGLVAHRRVL